MYKILSRIRPIELAQLIKRTLNLKRVVAECGGYRFLVDPLSNFGGRLCSEASYEDENTALMKSILSAGDVFVDVGANEGWYSVIAAGAVGPSGSVVIIEPQERCWAAIHHNFLLNRLHNYRLEPYALGDTEKESDIVLYPSLNNEASSLVAQPRTRHFARQKVQVTTFDAIIERLNLRSIKLVKIDCEGYELEVLKGAVNALRRRLVERILIELHPRQLTMLGHDTSHVTNFLKTAGFEQETSGGTQLWVRAGKTGG